MGLVPRPGIVSAKRLALEGLDLRAMSDAHWLKLRGSRMSMVMQDPKYSLNPVIKIGHQIRETYLLHHRSTRSEAGKRALRMLDAVGIRDADLVFDLYPHQLSGGMGQRAMIAAMLIAEPDLLIADEPTSALDVTVQNQVLRILDDLVTDRGMGLIFISHNLTIVSSFCDRVLVMYGGKIIEECRANELNAARHPYTRALIEAAPSLDYPKAELSVVSRRPEWLT